MSNITIATSSVAFEQRLRRSLGADFTGRVTRWQSDLLYVDGLQAVKELALDSPDVIIVGPNVAADVALELAQAIDQEHPEIEVILVVDVVPGLWEMALRARVSDVIDPTSGDEEIRGAVTRALDTVQRRRHNLVVDTGLEPSSSGRIITVVSPKGGAGKTALSTNMAVELAAIGAGTVVIVDLDLQFGDVGNALGLDPEHTIAELAAAPGGVNMTTLKVFMTQWGENLHAMCAPLSPAEGEQIPEGVVDKTLRLLGESFDYVIVDTSAGVNEATLAAIDRSTDLVFLCDLSVSALKGLRKIIDAIDGIGITEPQRHFVLNRADSDVGINPSDAAALVGMEIDAEIPSSRSIPLAQNQGIPVNQEAPRTPVARAFEQVAEHISGVQHEKKRGFSLRRGSK